MFNGMYTGESGQPTFGYGMEAQQNYGQEQDPYSVSYYQAAAAQYQRSIGKLVLSQKDHDHDFVIQI